MIYTIKWHKNLIHYQSFRKIGRSRWEGQQLAHYDSSQKAIGCTVPDCFDQNNVHYGFDGAVLGYSRQKKSGRIIHYDTRGHIIGISRPIFLIGWGTKGTRLTHLFS